MQLQTIQSEAMKAQEEAQQVLKKELSSLKLKLQLEQNKTLSDVRLRHCKWRKKQHSPIHLIFVKGHRINFSVHFQMKS